MDEKSTKLLHYGHLGRAVYDSKSQSWSFARTVSPPPRISYTGFTKVAVLPSSAQNASTPLPKRLTLSRGYPELIAGYRLARSETLSQTISATSETCDPLVSTLLDFGRAVDTNLDDAGRRAVPIVAFASGESGNVISFRTITDDTVQLKHETEAQLHVPTIADEDGVEWSAQGAPVRQICFSNAPEERATFMAARFSSTLVFRPLYHRFPASVSINRGSDGTVPGYRVSRMDPNLLLEISTSHTGGAAHADVKFNPWDQSQIAIVDHNGNWSIWVLRIQPKRNRDNWIATAVRSGALPSVGVEEVSTGTMGRHDGWLAIEWAGNENSIVVSDRRCSMLYRMEGNRAYPYAMELGFESFKKRSEWILGIKRSALNPSHLFVLTTSRIIWFDIALESVLDHESTRPSLSPRLSWRHFCDSDDTTLQLSSLTADEGFYLVLFSRLSPLALAFYCSETSEIVNGSTAVPDPQILHMPASSRNAGGTDSSPNDLRLSTLVFKEYAPVAAGERDMYAGLSFFKAFMVDSSLCIRESIYSKPSASDFGSERLLGDDLLRVKQLRLTGLQNKAENPLSGFIVDDWDELARDSGPIYDYEIANIAPTADPYFTLDYEQIYGIATGTSDLLLQDDEKNTERNFQESIDELVANLTAHIFSEEPTTWTALEILRKPFILDDIDKNAHDLAVFVAQSATNPSLSGGRGHLVQQYESFKSQPAQQPNAADARKLYLVALYDRLVNNWLIDLPADIPGRARIMKEKSIRHFVADIVLSQIIAVRGSEEPDPATNGGGAQSTSTSGLTYAEESAPNKTATESDDYGLHPQPSNTATQSTFTLGNSMLPEHSEDKLPTFSVLSSYTTFNRTDSSSRDAERLFDHWKPGADPASYSLLSEEQQSAASIRASRRKSKKRMSQAMRSLSLDTPVPPSVSTPAPAVRGDWGSQPDNSQPPMIHLPSSQVKNDLPMTQVERGTFGGREATKKAGIKARKKKRAAGF
ncbi:RNA polymerase I-specific transcription initiation factor RRN6-like protein [Aspergillus venezuelensis]